MQVKNLKIVVAAAFAVAICSYATANAHQTKSMPLPSATDRYPTQSTQPGSSQFPDDKSGVDNPMRARMEDQAAKARNSERFKRIQSDTDKLLRLSTELKEDVDKSTKNEMSLDVIRKAAEVEKLAHDVKERMKG